MKAKLGRLFDNLLKYKYEPLDQNREAKIIFLMFHFLPFACYWWRMLELNNVNIKYLQNTRSDQISQLGREWRPTILTDVLAGCNPQYWQVNINYPPFISPDWPELPDRETRSTTKVLVLQTLQDSALMLSSEMKPLTVCRLEARSYNAGGRCQHLKCNLKDQNTLTIMQQRRYN